MKYILIATILLFGFSASAVQAGTVTKSTLEKKAYKLVNHYRVDQGLNKLIWNKHITKIARKHSKNMAHGITAFGHDGFSDRVTQIQRYIPDLISANENVAYTTVTSGVARRIVNQWLESKSHRENIEGENYNATGIGVAKYGEYYYFTEILEEN